MTSPETSSGVHVVFDSIPQISQRSRALSAGSPWWVRPRRAATQARASTPSASVAARAESSASGVVASRRLALLLRFSTTAVAPSSVRSR